MTEYERFIQQQLTVHLEAETKEHSIEELTSLEWWAHVAESAALQLTRTWASRMDVQEYKEFDLLMTMEV